MRSLKCVYKVRILFFLLLVVFVRARSDRIKRTLVYPPPGSKIQMIAGAGFPVALEDVSVTMGYVFKAAYRLPTNSSDYTEPGVILQRKRRDDQINRWNVYNIMSMLLARFGGKSCILRSICELAESSPNENVGFIDEIFEVIFRPSSTQDVLSNSVDADYMSAERIGRSVQNGCHVIYPECSISLIDLFTKLM